MGTFDKILTSQDPLNQKVRHHARRLLRLGSRTGNLLEIIEIMPRTLDILNELWNQRLSPENKDSYIKHHPFMQYLALLIKIRVLNHDASYPQLERVIEQMI